MLSKLFQKQSPSEPLPKEGDLYKTVNVQGVLFALQYGYYEECDRQNPLVDPMPIYPNFVKDPQYTLGGTPIITMMQDACERYKGKQTTDVDCGMCEYFQRDEELFGLCACPKNQKRSETVFSLSQPIQQIQKGD